MQFESGKKAREYAQYTLEFGHGAGDFEGRLIGELAEAYKYIGDLLDRIDQLEKEEQ